MSIDVVAPLDQSEFKLVLVPVGVRVVAAMRASEDKVESQSINEAIFLESHDDTVALFLHLNQWNFLKLILDDFRMRGPNQKIQLSEIEHSVEHSKVVFF